MAPWVSISTFAQLLPQQYERKEFRDEFFKIVAHEVTRVDLLVENLTFFAHPLILRYEEVDLGALLDNVLASAITAGTAKSGYYYGVGGVVAGALALTYTVGSSAAVFNQTGVPTSAPAMTA